MSFLKSLTENIESAVEMFAPAIAAQREQARSRLGILKQHSKRYYDAASSGRRTAGWRKVESNTYGAIPGLTELQSRARDLVRNNGYAKKGVGGIVANTVGTGIVAQVRVDSKNSKRKKEIIESKWKSWSNSTACDFDGLHTFGGLQRLAMRTLVESGEVLVRYRFVELDPSRPLSSQPVPIQLQVLECDYLDTTKDTNYLVANGNTIVQGVEFNAEGQRVAYHIYLSKPGSATSGNLLGQSVRVAASECVHLFRQDRPGQIRGVPWAAAIILNLKDLDDYEDAELMRRKVSACFAGFVSDSDLDDLSPGAQASKGLGIDKIEPGMLEDLPPGKTITFNNPPVGGDYSPYTVTMLRKVGSGLEVPYEVLTGDYSQVNFSSGRMGWLEFQRLVEEWRWLLFIPRLLDKVWGWFSIACSLQTGLSFDDVSVDWTPPRREMIDPSKEIPAILETVRAGLMSLPEAIREMGYDPDQVLSEIATFNEKLDENKIILDSDPRVENNQMIAKTAAQKTSNLKSGKVA